MTVFNPPVPAKLLEKLREYPDHIDRLQEVLNVVAAEPPSIIPRLERATEALQGRLGTFMSEARRELEQAKASGDPTLIAAAEVKFSLMSQVRLKHVWISDEGFLQYFEGA
ncbi:MULTISPECIES: hypothetical protein [unclassified Stenotrophomonas]|uniref:hypothetical protein n=1 Tax=unclassified Stenotrophomonas TaxID=196198 RepID=UPI002118D27B|nr:MULTISPECIES: hypothetical protein [unclassified Stenotrophomonas]